MAEPVTVNADVGHSDSGPLSLLAGTSTMLVGLEDQEDGGLRLYLNHRSLGLYALVYDEDVKAEVRATWNGSRRHVLVPTPPADAIYQEEPSHA